MELDRNVIDLVRQHFHAFAGDLYSRPLVQVHEAEARGFVSASQDQYDLVQVALMDSFGTASAGLYGLSESYLYTVEALQTYLSRLTPSGMLAVTRWLTLPPRDALKLFATAVVALERNGVSDPAARLVMMRGWKTVTLLVKNSDFTLREIEAIKEFGRARSFDVAYYPGMSPEEANRYNMLEQPYFFEGAVALLGPQRQAFIDRYKFYIEPATDDRPYFFRLFKWEAASELLALREQGGMPLLDWSYPLLVATLVQAFIASVLLILAPLAASRARHALPSAPVALYFLAIGLAFMFMEIAFIQKFILFLAHPLYAVAVVLCAFLIFAAAGSWLAGRLQKRSAGSRHLTFAVIAIGSVIATLSRRPAGLVPDANPFARSGKNSYFDSTDRASGNMHGDAFSDWNNAAGINSPGIHSLGVGNQWFCLGSGCGTRHLAGYSPGLCRSDSAGGSDLRFGCCGIEGICLAGPFVIHLLQADGYAPPYCISSFLTGEGIAAFNASSSVIHILSPLSCPFSLATQEDEATCSGCG